MAAVERQQRRTWQGAALLAGLVALASLVFFLDDLISALAGRVRLVAVLTEARSVRPGAPVWIAGKRAGHVETIQILPNGTDTSARLALTLLVAERHLDQVPAGSRVRITSERFIGEPVIDIVPGPPDAPIVRPGDTLHGRRGAGGAAVILKARALRTAIELLNQEARQLTEPGRQRTLDIARLERNLRAVQREFASLAAVLESGAGFQLTGAAGVGASVDRLTTTAHRIAQALEQASARHGGGSRRVAQALEQLRGRSNALAADAAALSALLGESGTLRRLQTDSALVKGVHAVQAQLDSLIAEARRNPLRFVF